MTEQLNNSLAIVGGTNILDLFTTTAQLVTETELPSREIVRDFCKAALRMVATDVRMDNISRAIDTMQKTKAIEDYVKEKVKQQHGNMVLGNEVAITRARQLRELGWWLDENIAKGGESRSGMKRTDGRSSPFVRLSNVLDHPEMSEIEKPKFFLDEIGATRTQSSLWQQIYHIPEEEFEAYVAEFQKDGDTKIEKYFFPYHLITWWYKSDKEEDGEVVIPGEITTAEGKKLYLWMHQAKDLFTNYVELIRTGGVPLSELMVLTGLPFWQNLGATWHEFKRLVKVDNEDTTS